MTVGFRGGSKVANDDDVLAMIRKIEAWGRRHEVALPSAFGTDLAEAYRSAAMLRTAVDVLLRESSSSEEVSKALADIEAWGAGDLLDHLHSLKRSLNEVFEQLP